MVSIIMMSHDCSPYVEETVRSVMAQTYQDWELLFVDDSSNDEIRKLLMQLRDEDDKGRMMYCKGILKKEVMDLKGLI